MKTKKDHHKFKTTSRLAKHRIWSTDFALSTSIFLAVPRRFDSIRELKTCSYKFLDSSFPSRHHVHGPNRTKSQLHAVHPPSTHMSSSSSSFHFNVFLMLQKCIKKRLGVINNKRVLFRAAQQREMCNKNKQYEGGMTAHASVLVLGWIFPSGVGEIFARLEFDSVYNGIGEIRLRNFCRLLAKDAN